MKRINFKVSLKFYKIIMIILFFSPPLIIFNNKNIDILFEITFSLIIFLLVFIVSHLYLIYTINDNIHLTNFWNKKQYLKNDFDRIKSIYGNLNFYKIYFKDGKKYFFGLSNSKMLYNVDIESTIKELEGDILK